jgi:hypothetical protein
MEKQGEIRPELTPQEEYDDEGEKIVYPYEVTGNLANDEMYPCIMPKTAAAETTEEDIVELEDHVTKRASDAVKDGLQ